MPRLALITLLCLSAGLACAGTFELSDPANEMLEDQQAMEEWEPEQCEPEPRPAGSDNTLCSVDTATGACTCIDKKLAKKLLMTREECVERVMESLQVENR